MTLPVKPAAAADRRAAWRAAFPVLSDDGAAALAARHAIDPALIAQVAMDARAGVDIRPGGQHNGQADGAGASDMRPGTGRLDARVVASLIRRRADLSLPPGVELITPACPGTGWSCRRRPASSCGTRSPGCCTRARCSTTGGWADGAGPPRRPAAADRAPGTGKSLAAEVLATAAQTDLLRVDLSQIVSKWLGETEKNLAGVFDAAERTQAVLVLDEADALFGTRTEISDAHDRYANLETAYLLQRLDSFEGLLVLTTNLRHNIDAAFVRRMDFVIDFPLPDQAACRELWRLHLPGGHVADEVDLDVLARMYPVPGGWIRNAALTAAFAAAVAGGASVSIT